LYTLKPYYKPISPFAWWEGAFSDEELDWLQEQARAATSSAEIGTNANAIVSEKIRRSKVSWLRDEPKNNWAYQKFSDVASSLNADYFGFDLEGMEELQLTNYSEEDRGTYGWHQDFGSTVPFRKLSLSLQLSHPSDYDGGELQIKCHSEAETMNKKRGLITVFPAWTLHQVTPVTRGSRQSLVAWVSGEPFK
tara:strand:+ start:709 stop:1287 length:579 start_codon:yes stop_codon:yes gene_type:complete